jgi:hypothetical protein
MTTQGSGRNRGPIRAELTATKTVFTGSDRQLIYEISAHAHSMETGGLRLLIRKVTPWPYSLRFTEAAKGFAPDRFGINPHRSPAPAWRWLVRI